MCCGECGNENVIVTANALWSVGKQDWVVDDSETCVIEVEQKTHHRRG
jgi:hypothetical protein